MACRSPAMRSGLLIGSRAQTVTTPVDYTNLLPKERERERERERDGGYYLVVPGAAQRSLGPTGWKPCTPEPSQSAFSPARPIVREPAVCCQPSVDSCCRASFRGREICCELISERSPRGPGLRGCALDPLRLVGALRESPTGPRWLSAGSSRASRPAPPVAEPDAVPARQRPGLGSDGGWGVVGGLWGFCVG